MILGRPLGLLLFSLIGFRRLIFINAFWGPLGPSCDPPVEGPSEEAPPFGFRVSGLGFRVWGLGFRV